MDTILTLEIVLLLPVRFFCAEAARVYLPITKCLGSCHSVSHTCCQLSSLPSCTCLKPPPPPAPQPVLLVESMLADSTSSILFFFFSHQFHSYHAIPFLVLPPPASGPVVLCSPLSPASCPVTAPVREPAGDVLASQPSQGPLTSFPCLAVLDLEMHHPSERPGVFDRVEIFGCNLRANI